MNILDALALCGAVSWLTTLFVAKDGPGGVVDVVREWVKRHLPEKWNPLTCFFCTSFYAGVVVLLLWFVGGTVGQYTVYFFGMLGVALALRGASGEW